MQLKMLHTLLSVALTPLVGRHGLVRLPNDVMLHDLWRVRCPVVPHVAEHGDQSDHCVHKPGTEEEKKQTNVRVFTWNKTIH